jgi:hypothetical protein
MANISGRNIAYAKAARNRNWRGGDEDKAGEEVGDQITRLSKAEVI